MLSLSLVLGLAHSATDCSVTAASASSVEGKHAARGVVDGDSATFWQSIDDGQFQDEWIKLQVMCASESTLSGAILEWSGDAFARGYSFFVKTSTSNQQQLAWFTYTGAGAAARHARRVVH